MLIIEQEDTIKIYEYPLKYFQQSDKAIWINTRWDTHELRLQSLHSRMFIPRSCSFIDNKMGRLFISKYLMDKIVSEYKRDHYQYKFYLPSPTIHNISVSRWSNAKGRHN